MSELKQICQQLDLTLETYFDTLDRLLQAQNEMDRLMKDGYYLMAKARYNMGVKSVSQLQYNEDQMVANLKVEVKLPSNDNSCIDVEGAEFSLLQLDKTPTKEELQTESKDQDETSEGLRKRTTKASDSVTGLTESIEELEVNGTPSKTRDTKSKIRDPIKWFGVLVPQSLRQTQRYFRRVVELSCEVATLKASLEPLRVQYRECFRRKQQILADF